MIKRGSFFGGQYQEGNSNEYPGIKFSINDGILWKDTNTEYTHHEFIQLPWGDYMGIVQEKQDGPILREHLTDSLEDDICNVFEYACDGSDNGTTIEGTNEWPWLGDKLVIWDDTTKVEKWTWSAFDHFNMIDYDELRWAVQADMSPFLTSHFFEWTHINAFYFDKRDSSIYISTRNLSRITKLTYPSGEIIWDMGHQYQSGDVEFGENLNFSYQHSISLTDTDNILLFDNGSYSVQWNNAVELTSRGLEISVSENQGAYEAEIIWQYPLTLSSTLYGSDAGSAQQLKNGNYLLTTLGGSPKGTSLEISPEGDIIWEAHFNTEAIWRASRINFGCTDVEACNFSGSLSNVDDGSCEYPEENYNCSGNCIVAKDCAEICGGSSERDECNICNGDGSSCSACLETLGNNACNPPNCNHFMDECDTCDADSSNDCVQDCAGTWGGSLVDDGCGECGGNGPVDGYDCNGVELSQYNNHIPKEFNIQNIYPNPFNPVVNINFEIANSDFVSGKIYNLNGQLIEVLFSEYKSIGSYNLIWDASLYPSGIYLLILENRSRLLINKMVLLK